MKVEKYRWQQRHWVSVFHHPELMKVKKNNRWQQRNIAMFSLAESGPSCQHYIMWCIHPSKVNVKEVVGVRETPGWHFWLVCNINTLSGWDRINRALRAPRPTPNRGFETGHTVSKELFCYWGGVLQMSSSPCRLGRWVDLGFSFNEGWRVVIDQGFKFGLSIRSLEFCSVIKLNQNINKRFLHDSPLKKIILKVKKIVKQHFVKLLYFIFLET